jgi:hypothetical protein
MVEEEKCKTESKIPLYVSREVSQRKNVCGDTSIRKGMLPFEPRGEWKEGY